MLNSLYYEFIQVENITIVCVQYDDCVWVPYEYLRLGHSRTRTHTEVVS